MLDETVEGWFERLATGSPAPGGGAVVALQAGLGAALLVAACTTTLERERYRAHAALLRDLRLAAEDLRLESLALAAAGGGGLEAVGVAYRLPRTTIDERAERERRIRAAMAAVVETPLRTARVAARVIELAGELLSVGNPNAVADAGTAAYTAAAALEGAALRVRDGTAQLADAAVADRAARELGQVLDYGRRLAHRVLGEVEAQLSA